MVGTNPKNGKDLVKGIYNDLSWWSNNIETVAHYYEGCVIQIKVRLDSDRAMKYVCNVEEANKLCLSLSRYTYGFDEVICPRNANWYSFNGEYLRHNVAEVKEIFPDLSEFNEK